MVLSTLAMKCLQGLELDKGSIVYCQFGSSIRMKSTNLGEYHSNSAYIIGSFFWRRSRRNTIHYILNLSPFFTALALLSFFLPPDSGERITLVISNLLAMTVFMLIVAEIMPATSEVIPLISIYFTGIMFEVRWCLVPILFYFFMPQQVNSIIQCFSSCLIFWPSFSVGRAICRSRVRFLL